jgi:hypothetical protein
MEQAVERLHVALVRSLVGAVSIVGIEEVVVVA